MTGSVNHMTASARQRDKSGTWLILTKGVLFHSESLCGASVLRHEPTEPSETMPKRDLAKVVTAQSRGGAFLLYDAPPFAGGPP